MFDLGRSFLASVERNPRALAIVDGDQRLSYSEWYAEICRVADGLAVLGLRKGDHLAVVLPNRLAMASVHWACQMAGIIVTPFNWRVKVEELDCASPMRKLARSSSRRFPQRRSPVPM
jgi:2-furoate---CoA ligase